MISVFGSKVGEAEISNVIEVMHSQWLGFGKKVADFEEKFKEKRNLQHFTMVDSGSNALYMAVKLLNLPVGSEIIIPTFTWVSCAQAVLMAGLVPVFCDVELNSFNVSIDTIEPHITKKTSAIMVVHFAGKPVDLNPIISLGLPIIEDAAHAVVSSYYGKSCGGIGDVGIFSFDAVKNLTAGEGGGISTNSQELSTRAKTLRYCGIGKSGFEAAAESKENIRWWEYNISEPFIKMLPTNIAAAIALAQLSRIEDLQSIRKRIWDQYQYAFSDIEWILRPLNPEFHETHSYFTYAIRVQKRDLLSQYLLKKNIYSTLRYHPLHMNKIYNSNTELINSEQLNEDCLSIPLHPNLSQNDVNYIIETILSFKKFL